MKQSTKSIVKKAIIALALTSGGILSAANFVPGEGGTLPSFPTFVNLPNKFGGFKVTSSARENNIFGGGTRAIVEMWFPAPSTIGATSYTLQYSTNGTDWANYQSGYTDVTTTGDNFSMNLDGSYHLRLLANGGPKNGYTSNEVFAPLSSVDTYLGGWGLDESMYLSGIMSPWAGRGLLASFTIKKLSDNSVVNNCMTYQWYRLNPLTYETTIIPGADSLKYITTEADAGYDLLIKATADGINAGGYAQIISSSGTQIGNKSFASNVTTSGFTLNLYKSVNSLTIQDLTLTNKNYDTVTITGVNQGANAAIYTIDATLDPAKAPYQLSNKSKFWKIASTFMMMDLMPFLNISFDTPTSAENLESTTSIFPNPTSDVINIKSKDEVQKVNLIGVNGVLVKSIVTNTNNLTIDVASVSAGLYLLQIQTSNGNLYNKIEIKR